MLILKMLQTELLRATFLKISLTSLWSADAAFLHSGRIASAKACRLHGEEGTRLPCGMWTE